MKPTTRFFIGVVVTVLTATTVYADHVWHCSRTTTGMSATEQTPAPQDQFSIASVSSSADVIGVSVRDLMDVYSGTPVRIGGLPLSACFLMGNDSLTHEALTSLGVKLSTIEALARKNSIVQSNLYYVNDESKMDICIGKNFPAVGYMSKLIETDKVMPCF